MLKMSSFCLHASSEVLAPLGTSIVNNPLIHIAGHTPDFIPPTLWPPNSQDFNLVDNKMWSVMQEQVYQTPIYMMGMVSSNVCWLSGRLRISGLSIISFTYILTDKVQTLIFFYLLNKMLRCVGLKFLVEFSNNLESFSMIYDQA